MNPFQHYTLDEHGSPKPCGLFEWGEMFSDIPRRTVKKEYVGDLLISTVFLGIDHSFGRGPPVLWETMVFQNNPDPELRKRFPKVELDGYTDRCSGNREQAEAMHERVVALVKKQSV